MSLEAEDERTEGMQADKGLQPAARPRLRAIPEFGYPLCGGGCQPHGVGVSISFRRGAMTCALRRGGYQPPAGRIVCAPTASFPISDT